MGRVSRNIFEQASVGAISTLGDPASTDDPFLVGGDFGYRSTRLLGDNILRANAFVLGTWTETTRGDDNLAYGGKVRMPNDLYTFNVGFYQVDEGFNPALGFAPRKGVRNYSGILRYRPRLESVDFVRQIFFNYLTSSFTDLEDELETATHAFWPVYILFESTDELYFSVNAELDRPDSDFAIHPGVTIPPDRHWWTFYRFGFLTARRRNTSVHVDYFFGDFYDGQKDTYRVDFRWCPVRFFSVSLGYRHNDVRLPQGDFQVRLASTRLKLTLTPDLSWHNLVQYDDVTQTIGFSSRIRWEFRPGAFAYLVLNQNVDRDHGRPSVRQSAVTAKVGMSFRF